MKPEDEIAVWLHGRYGDLLRKTRSSEQWRTDARSLLNETRRIAGPKKPEPEVCAAPAARIVRGPDGAPRDEPEEFRLTLGWLLRRRLPDP